MERRTPHSDFAPSSLGPSYPSPSTYPLGPTTTTMPPPVDSPQEGFLTRLKAKLPHQRRSRSPAGAGVSPGSASAPQPQHRQSTKTPASPAAASGAPAQDLNGGTPPRTPAASNDVVAGLNNPPPEADALARKTAAAAAITRDLWQEAFDELSERGRREIKRLAGGPVSSASLSQQLDDLVKMAEEKREKCDRETWKVHVDGREIILRDYAVKVVGGLTMAGEIGIDFAPVPAKLVWPMIKGIMEVSGLALVMHGPVCVFMSVMVRKSRVLI